MIFNNDDRDGSILNHECKRKREPSRRIVSQTHPFSAAAASKEDDACSHNSIPIIQRRKRRSQLITDETFTCIPHTPIIHISRAKTSRIMIGILVIMLFYDTVWSFSILNHNTHGRSKRISSSFVFHSSLLASVDNAREQEYSFKTQPGVFSLTLSLTTIVEFSSGATVNFQSLETNQTKNNASLDIKRTETPAASMWTAYTLLPGWIVATGDELIPRM